MYSKKCSQFCTCTADPYGQKKILRSGLRALAQGQQIIIPDGAASFAFEDRDYSATEKEEIVSALYSLSGTVPEGGTSNIVAARDENNQQVPLQSFTIEMRYLEPGVMEFMVVFLLDLPLFETM